MKWGTSSPIQIKDPEYNFVIGLKSNGVYSLAINEPKKFLLTLIGSNVEKLKFTQVGELFREYFLTKIREFIHETITNEKIPVLEIESKLSFLSEKISNRLNDIVSEYGLVLKRFLISEISISQDDPNYALISNAYAKKASIKIQGEDYERGIQAEALLNSSKNEGMGGIPGVIAAGITLNSINKINNNSNNNFVCNYCGNPLPDNAKFCSNCGKMVEKKLFCCECGSENSIDSKFCMKCGAKLRKE